MSHYTPKQFEAFVKSIIEWSLVVERTSVEDVIQETLISYPYLRPELALKWVTEVAQPDVVEQAERQAEVEAQRRMERRAFDGESRITGW